MDFEDVVAGLDDILMSLTAPMKQKSLSSEGLFGTCESVAELAAVNRCSELKAATYAIQNFDGALYDDAVQYIKALQPSPETNHTGVMLCLSPDWNTRQQLAMFDGDDPGQLHLTIYYAGNTDGDDQVSEAQITKLKEIGHQVAFNADGPIRAQANGLTRFTGEDTDPCVINVDSPEISLLHREVSGQIMVAQDQGMNFRKNNHGFTPHITLGYLDPESPMPLDRWAAHEVVFPNLELWVGGEITSWRLGATEEYEDGMYEPQSGEKRADADDEPAITVNMHDFKDVFGGDGPGGMPHRRGVRRKKRIYRPELIERLHRLQNPREIK